MKAPPEAVRLAISLVHQPAAEGETAMADTKPEPDGGSLKARAAMFGGGGKMTSQAAFLHQSRPSAPESRPSAPEPPPC